MKYLFYLLDYTYDYLNEKKLIIPTIIKHFQDQNDSFDVYVNNDYKFPWSLSKQQLSQKLNDINDTNNNNNLKDNFSYDVLLIPLDRGLNKKLDKSGDTIKILDTFRKNKKKIIGFKITGNLECHDFGPDIHYGIPTDYYIKPNIPEVFISPEKHQNHFICPIIAESPQLMLDKTKISHLSKIAFYKKYRIPLKYKIITLLPGNLAKLHGIVEKYYNKNDQKAHYLYPLATRIVHFFKNLLLIKNKLEQQYVILLKEYKINQKYTKNPYYQILQKFQEIPSTDVYSLYTYTDCVFTIGTTLAYELYLYNLPTVEFGTGEYFHRWSYGEMKRHQFNQTLSEKFNNGKDVIFGQIIPIEILSTNNQNQNQHILIKWLNSFLKDVQNKKYQIKDFKWSQDHPFYGSTFDFNLDKFHQIISNV